MVNTQGRLRPTRTRAERVMFSGTTGSRDSKRSSARTTAVTRRETRGRLSGTAPEVTAAGTMAWIPAGLLTVRASPFPYPLQNDLP